MSIKENYKKYLIGIISVLLFFSPHQYAQASTIYSNNFTSIYNGFTTSFGSCTPGLNGLTCNNAVGIYNTPFSSLKCVSGDFTLTGNNIGGNIVIPDTSFSLGNLVDVVFIPGTQIYLNFTHQNNIGYGHWDTGIITPLGTHIYTLCEDSNVFSVFLDKSLILEQSISFNGNYGGFQLASGDKLTNFEITDEYPTPVVKTVPLLKQTSEPWQGLTYDSANIWANSNPTINSWGCALTSSAMVLQYYGYSKLPDGTTLTPGTLNEWLKNEPDGYIGNGNLNWMAISRLSKQAHDVNSITNFDALEYTYSTMSGQLLASDLNDTHPVILNEPGHFIVATGVNGSTFNINDPFYNRILLTDSYNNTAESMRRYIPSFTDLSYIMVAAPTSSSVSILDSQNDPIGTEYIENPIVDPNMATPSGDPVKIVSAQKPTSGKYTVVIWNSGHSANLPIVFLYDKNGEVKKQNINQSSTNTFTISFDKNNITGSTIDTHTNIGLLYSLLLQELKQAYSSHLIAKSTYLVFLNLLETSSKNYNKHHTLVAKISLQTMITLSHTPLKKTIDQIFAQSFFSQIQSLSNSL